MNKKQKKYPVLADNIC